MECSKCSMFMLINNVSNHAFRSPSRASANMCLVCKWQVQAIVAVWSMLAQLLFLQRPPNPTRQLKSHTTGPHWVNMQDFLLIMHYAALTLFSHPAKQWNIQLALTVTHISNSPKRSNLRSKCPQNTSPSSTPLRGPSSTPLRGFRTFWYWNNEIWWLSSSS